MKIKTISKGELIASEIVSDKVIIKNTQDALDMMANCPTTYIILRDYNFEKEFFNLKTKIAGEILQKFSNYFVKLAIVGDFSKFKSNSLQAFIYENNRIGDHLFVGSIEEAIKIWRERTL